MSGGSLDYLYSKIEMAMPTKDSLLEEYGYLMAEDKECQHLAMVCVEKLHEAVVIAKRLEWWLSGDDGNDSFKGRMREELGYDLTAKKFVIE